MRRRNSESARVVWLSIGFVAAAVTGIAGCFDAGHDGESRPGSTPSESLTAITGEAAEFGGIVIPGTASVLEVRTEHGRDTLYQLALSTSPDGVQQLLRASNFSAPLVKVFRVAETAIAGPPLDTSPSILRAEDQYRGSDGKSVYRIIIVDERDQGSRYIHIQLFDT